MVIYPDTNALSHTYHRLQCYTRGREGKVSSSFLNFDPFSVKRLTAATFQKQGTGYEFNSQVYPLYCISLHFTIYEKTLCYNELRRFFLQPCGI